jgi:hypothetical protein
MRVSKARGPANANSFLNDGNAHRARRFLLGTAGHRRNDVADMGAGRHVRSAVAARHRAEVQAMTFAASIVLAAADDRLDSHRVRDRQHDAALHAAVHTERECQAVLEQVPAKSSAAGYAACVKGIAWEAKR